VRWAPRKDRSSPGHGQERPALGIFSTFRSCPARRRSASRKLLLAASDRNFVSSSKCSSDSSSDRDDNRRGPTFAVLISERFRNRSCCSLSMQISLGRSNAVHLPTRSAGGIVPGTGPRRTDHRSCVHQYHGCRVRHAVGLPFRGIAGRHCPDFCHDSDCVVRKPDVDLLISSVSLRMTDLRGPLGGDCLRTNCPSGNPW